jgi:hypothetical protein
MLPPLPQINKQTEAKASLKLRAWLKANPRSSCSIEMKDSRSKNTFNLKEITDEQINYALAIQGDKGVLVRTTGVVGLPDYIYLRQEPAYFCIKFPKGFCLINVNNIVHERNVLKKKSLVFSRAKDISVITF